MLLSFSWNLILLNDQEFSRVFKTIFRPLVADIEKRLHDSHLLLTVASLDDHTELKSRRYIHRNKPFRRFIKALGLQIKTLSSIQQEQTISSYFQLKPKKKFLGFSAGH